jgi:ferric iron reductase protein FhuF
VGRFRVDDRLLEQLISMSNDYFCGPQLIPLLLHFANFEQYFDKTSMEHYVAAASDPKKVLYYDTGHDLNDPKALEDRYDWLVKNISLRRESVLTR